MAKRIAVGIAATRGESMVLEGILKSMGIPATSELGNVMSEFADVAQGWIYVDEDGLNKATVPLIEDALGPIADRSVMDHYRNVEPTKERPAEVHVVVGRFPNRHSASDLAKLLRGRGVPAQDGVTEAGEHIIVVERGALEPKAVSTLRDYLGDWIDPEFDRSYR